jgi:hypothetical protein
MKWIIKKLIEKSNNRLLWIADSFSLALIHSLHYWGIKVLKILHNSAKLPIVAWKQLKFRLRASKIDQLHRVASIQP